MSVRSARFEGCYSLFDQVGVVLGGADQTRWWIQLGHHRERAAVCGKLLKLRDTDGFRKQFQ